MLAGWKIHDTVGLGIGVGGEEFPVLEDLRLDSEWRAERWGMRKGASLRTFLYILIFTCLPLVKTLLNIKDWVPQATMSDSNILF